MERTMPLVFREPVRPPFELPTVFQGLGAHFWELCALDATPRYPLIAELDKVGHWVNDRLRGVRASQLAMPLQNAASS
jgi:hypothetical protein